MHSKLLTKMAELKQVKEENLPDNVECEKAREAMQQAHDQLERVRDTITHHTKEISGIKALLKEKESSGEESSSPSDYLSPGPMNPIDATQEEDVKMEDIKDISNPPQGTATQTDPIAEEVENKPIVDGGMDLMTPSGNQPIMEGGGTTPISPEDDKLLEYNDEEENQAGAVTPSGVIVESLSQLNMDSPHTHTSNE